MSDISLNEEIKGKQYPIINDNTIHNDPKENDYSDNLDNNPNDDNTIIINNDQNNNIINTGMKSITPKEGSEDNKSNLLSNNNKDSETLNKLIDNIRPDNNNNVNIIDKKDINNNLEENEKKSVHSQFGIQYVIPPDSFQNMINEIKDYTIANKELVGNMVATNKELVQNMVGSINSYSEKVDNYTQRVDKLIEQNGEMIKLLTQVIMKNNINDSDHNKDKKKEGVDDNNKEKKKDEIHDEEKQN